MNELKPCPCGSEFSVGGLSPSWEYELDACGRRTGRKEWTVWCACCGRTGLTTCNRESAIAAWNTRTPQAEEEK